LHIGSLRMHINAKIGCVAERGEKWLERFRDVLKNIADSNDGFLFMEGVSSSLYNEDIIAFTPKGKGIILPKGATALDFAYEVHTNIGDHAQYARINGKLSPLKTQLRRGDCVEIGVSDTISPNPKWLDYVCSYKAKRRLREILRSVPDLGYKRCEVCRPLPGDEVIGFKDPVTGEISIHSRHCREAVRLASANGDCIVSVDFRESPEFSYPVRVQIVAIDRYHLLRDVVDCFVEKQHLSLDSLETKTEDQIVNFFLAFHVHSSLELQKTMANIAAIKGVDEVRRIDL